MRLKCEAFLLTGWSSSLGIPWAPMARRYRPGGATPSLRAGAGIRDVAVVADPGIRCPTIDRGRQVLVHRRLAGGVRGMLN
jgi:hypothetical protein